MTLVLVNSAPGSVLKVEARTAFRPARLGNTVGFVEADFMVENATPFEANAPFIGFSVLGLRFMTAPGWTQDYVHASAARRMIRFRASGQSVLGVGERVIACTLRIPLTVDQGGSLRMGVGIERRLADSSDIRIFYVVGAGNFPPHRDSVAIPASLVSEQIHEAFPWMAGAPEPEFAGTAH